MLLLANWWIAYGVLNIHPQAHPDGIATLTDCWRRSESNTSTGTTDLNGASGTGGGKRHPPAAHYDSVDNVPATRKYQRPPKPVPRAEGAKMETTRDEPVE